jgi:RNA polymerase sigma-70 factor (ECF subfamily)
MHVDFHGLFTRYSQDVYRFALYLSADPSLAEDICQETFVRAWVTPGELRGGTVKSYLLTIARNLYKDELRRQARQVALDETLLDPNPGPEAVAGGRLDLGAVLKALQTLAEIDRAALLMSVQDGMSYQEIAATLDLSVAAVKVKIHRARIKLKRVYDSRGDRA